MSVSFSFNITPLMLEHVLSTIIVVALLAVLAVVVKKFIGE